MNLISLLNFITSHPLNKENKFQSLLRFIKWQISSRLNLSPIIYPFTEKSKLIIQKGMTGATGNLYCGLHEFNDMSFLLHFLRPSDFFVDIGANVGSYTILASGHVAARTFSFEPVPSTFNNLKDNILINDISEKVTAFNMALGSETGTINFTTQFDTVNHVAKEDETNIINVPVDTLNNVLHGKPIPQLIKIDVEGFETEVIKGSSKILKKDELKAIIIELNGSGRRYGYNEQEIHDKLIKLEFYPYFYEPKKRELIRLEHFSSHNTIYIRDVDFVKKRVSSALKFRILGQEI